MHPNASEYHTVANKAYVLTWLALLVLTGITIWVASLQLGALSVLAALAVASIKAGLVLYVFMHLKYEEPIFSIILLVVVVTLTLIIAMTFLDVGFR